MNKTIYIRDEDIPTWDRARELAGDKLAPVIVDGLKNFVRQQEAESKGFERIEVSFVDSQNHNLATRKAFFGRWIFSQEEPFRIKETGSETVENHAVAITRKNNLVFLSWFTYKGAKSDYTFTVFPSFEAAARNPKFKMAAQNARVELGVPLEELDI